MATDIERAVNLLQAQNRSIAGVRRAPDMSAYPTQINTADLPYVLTWPGPGSWYQKGHGRGLDSRTFRILAFVQPLGQNDAPTRLVQATQLLERMRDHYVTPSVIALGDPGQNGGYQFTVESRDGNPQADDGISADLSYGGVVYLGFEIKLTVRIMWDASG